MEYINKEVDFNTYCPKCEHWDKQGVEDPCNACLTNYFNEHSKKPMYFKEKE